MTHPTQKPAPSQWPRCDAEEQEAVCRVLQSGKLNYWTGEEGRQFEREYADYVGQPYGVAIANGTLALELALYALDVGPGDEVIVPARTFIATASAVVARGARPICADVDPDSQNVTAESLAAQITPQTRALIVVHLAGWPCDMPAILELAEQHNLFVIEDCAQAHGARLNGRQVGAFGHAATYSFCQDKIITTGGEGGMLLLRDEQPWRRAWSYKDHGKDWDAVHEPNPAPGFRWLHHTFGSNWRLTEMQSAIGRVALRNLNHRLKIRSRNAQILNRRLAACDALRIPTPPANANHAYYKWYGFVRPDRMLPSWNRDRILKELRSLGLAAFSGSCGEIYREGAFAEIHPHDLRLPIAQELSETSLMLQVDPTLQTADIETAANLVERVLNQSLDRAAAQAA